jgi:hypothetical protein
MKQYPVAASEYGGQEAGRKTGSADENKKADKNRPF